MSADFAEAFNLERVDLVAEITSPAAMLALGRARVGPADGLYVLDEPEGFRVYVQEKGEIVDDLSGLSFEEAREAVIDRLLVLNGIPFSV